jgi:hypothetical protein
VSLLGKLEAKARGEVSTAALVAYASANSEAYSLLDGVPPRGLARLAAWCAFVLQSYADNLLSCGSQPGYSSLEAFEQARVNYELVSPWLARARAAAMSESYALDVYVPQRLPQAPAERDAQQLRAMRRTLETVQARAGVDLEAFRGDPVHDRLAPTMSSLQSALDAAAGLSAPAPGTSVFAAVAQALQDGLDRAYQLGQLLALPELMEKAQAEASGPAPTSAGTMQLFLPGERGFDPWCLTDPIERQGRIEHDAAAAGLDKLWESDPEPAKTLAIQAEIADAIEHGAADYLPDDSVGSLAKVSSFCPWPGVLLAKAELAIGGKSLAPGDRFVFSVGPTAGGFRREILSIAAHDVAAFAAPPASDRLTRLADRLAGDGGNTQAR